MAETIVVTYQFVGQGQDAVLAMVDTINARLMQTAGAVTDSFAQIAKVGEGGGHVAGGGGEGAGDGDVHAHVVERGHVEELGKAALVANRSFEVLKVGIEGIGQALISGSLQSSIGAFQRFGSSVGEATGIAEGFLSKFGLFGVIGSAVAGTLGGMTVLFNELAQHMSENVLEFTELAKAAGMSTQQFANLEGAFLRAGVGMEQLHQIVRVTSNRIQAEWGDISRTVRDSADRQEEEGFRIEDANRKVADSYTLPAEASRKIEGAQLGAQTAKAAIPEAERTKESTEYELYKAQVEMRRKYDEQGHIRQTELPETYDEQRRLEQLQYRADSSHIKALEAREEEDDRNIKRAKMGAEAAREQESAIARNAFPEAREGMERAPMEARAAQRAQFDSLMKDPRNLAAAIRAGGEGVDWRTVAAPDIFRALTYMGGGTMMGTLSAASQFMNMPAVQGENFGATRSAVAQQFGARGNIAPIEEAIRKGEFEKVTPETLKTGAAMETALPDAEKVRDAWSTAAQEVRLGGIEAGKAFTPVAESTARSLGSIVENLGTKVKESVDGVSGIFGSITESGRGVISVFNAIGGGAKVTPDRFRPEKEAEVTGKITGNVIDAIKGAVTPTADFAHRFQPPGAAATGVPVNITTPVVNVNAGKTEGAPTHAYGGYITGPGTGTSDSIRAPWLSNGEYVIRADSVARVGVPFLDAINQGRGFFGGGHVGYAEGGLVDPGAGSAGDDSNSLKPYTPSWSERLRYAVQDIMSGMGASKGYSQEFAEKAETLAGGAPVVGQAINANEAYRSYMARDYVGAGLSGLGVMAMFGGPAAKTADLVALEAAKGMAAKGAAREEILSATKWFQGVDKKWRFEIPDQSEMHLVAPLPEKGETSWLDKTVSSPKIKEAYPTLFGGTEIQRGSLGRGMWQPGNVEPAGGVITPHTLSVGPGATRSTMLHEMQHGIQREEDFATGGNTLTLREGTPAWKIYQERLVAMRTPLSLEDFSKTSGYDNVSEAKNDYKGYLKIVKNPSPMHIRAAQDYAVQEAYRRTAGEVEARNVQVRMNMTPEERAMRPPWETQDVPDELQIVKFRQGYADGGIVGDDATDSARQGHLGELKPYTPSWSERLRATVQDIVSGMGASHGYSQEFAEKAETLAGFTPAVGQALSANEGYRAYQSGNKLGAVLGALGALPIPGAGVVHAAEKGAQKTIEEISEKWALQGVKLDISPGSGTSPMVLGRIVIPQEQRSQGIGSSVMGDIIAHADAVGKTVALTPSTDFGGSSVSRLRDFYKRFGFVENKGKNKDFAISESMLRAPLQNVRTEQAETDYDVAKLRSRSAAAEPRGTVIDRGLGTPRRAQDESSADILGAGAGAGDRGDLASDIAPEAENRTYAYHGTTKEFGGFAINPDAPDWENPDRILGLHFAKDPEVAGSFTEERYNVGTRKSKEGGRIIPVTLPPAKRFLDVPQPPHPYVKSGEQLTNRNIETDEVAISKMLGREGHDEKSLAKFLVEGRSETPEDASLHAVALLRGEKIDSMTDGPGKDFNYYIDSFQGAFPYRGEERRQMVERAREKLSSQGYAGLRYINTSPMETGEAYGVKDPTSYIVFSPRDIKSSITGEDMSKEAIGYADGGEVDLDHGRDSFKPMTSADILAGKAGPVQEARPYADPTFGGFIGRLFEHGVERLGAGMSIIRRAGEIGETVGGVTGVDMPFHVKQAIRRGQHGDYLGAGLEALGALPTIPAAGIGSGVARAAEKDAEAGLAKLGAAPEPSILAYHGSPHDFEKFSSEHIGKGEGAQSYGHGLYFAESEGVARSYRDNLSASQMEIEGKPFTPGNYAITKMVASGKGDLPTLGENLRRYAEEGKTNPFSNHEDAIKIADSIQQGKFTVGELGHMYQVRIAANPEHFLDWDKPLSGQHEKVRDAISTYYPQPTTRNIGHNQNLGENLVDLNVGKASVGVFPESKIPTDLDALKHMAMMNDPRTGEGWYREISQQVAAKEQARQPNFDVYSPHDASQALRTAGIPGIRYLDQGSRDIYGQLKSAQDGVKYWRSVGDADKIGKAERSLAALQEIERKQTRNYVVFDENLINIEKKYAIGGMVGGGFSSSSFSFGGSDSSLGLPGSVSFSPDIGATVSYGGDDDDRSKDVFGHASGGMVGSTMAPALSATAAFGGAFGQVSAVPSGGLVRGFQQGGEVGGAPDPRIYGRVGFPGGFLTKEEKAAAGGIITNADLINSVATPGTPEYRREQIRRYGHSEESFTWRYGGTTAEGVQFISPSGEGGPGGVHGVLSIDTHGKVIDPNKKDDPSLSLAYSDPKNWHVATVNVNGVDTYVLASGPSKDGGQDKEVHVPTLPPLGPKIDLPQVPGRPSSSNFSILVGGQEMEGGSIVTEKQAQEESGRSTAVDVLRRMLSPQQKDESTKEEDQGRLEAISRLKKIIAPPSHGNPLGSGQFGEGAGSGPKLAGQTYKETGGPMAPNAIMVQEAKPELEYTRKEQTGSKTSDVTKPGHGMLGRALGKGETSGGLETGAGGHGHGHGRGEAMAGTGADGHGHGTGAHGHESRHHKIHHGHIQRVHHRHERTGRARERAYNAEGFAPTSAEARHIPHAGSGAIYTPMPGEGRWDGFAEGGLVPPPIELSPEEQDAYRLASVLRSPRPMELEPLFGSLARGPFFGVLGGVASAMWPTPAETGELPAKYWPKKAEKETSVPIAMPQLHVGEAGPSVLPQLHPGEVSGYAKGGVVGARMRRRESDEDMWNPERAGISLGGLARVGAALGGLAIGFSGGGMIGAPAPASAAPLVAHIQRAAVAPPSDEAMWNPLHSVVGNEGYAMGGLVGGGTGALQPAGYHALDVRTNSGTIPTLVSETGLESIRRDAVLGKAISSGIKPSWWGG